MTAFEGFPADALAFLGELEANNEREWFNANKQRYTNSHANSNIYLYAYGD